MKKILSLLMMTLLAVSAWAASETIVFANLGYANQEEVSSISGDDFTMTFEKGTNSNAPKYFTTGSAIRVYGGNTFTVSSASKTIVKIEFTFASGEGTNEITTDVGTFSENSWTGSASTVVFTIGGTTGHRRIASVAVTYDDSSTPDLGEDIIFKFGTGEEFAQTNGEVMKDCTKQGVTIKFAKGSGSNDPKWYTATNGNARVYTNNTITVAALNKTINTVTFTYDGDNALNNPVPVDGTWSAPVWTLNAESGVLTIKNTARISTITVNIASEGNQVATPEIALDPAEGPYYEGVTTVTATITCDTEGAKIYYSTDGETWTQGTTLTVSETTTIQAKAVLGEQESSVASKKVTFTKVVTSIDAFNQLAPQTDLLFNAPVTVLGQKGNYLYVQDDTKGMLIYGTIDKEYELGDVIPAGFTGTRVDYKGAPEMSNPTGLQDGVAGEAPAPVELTPDQCNLENAFRYAVIKGATIDNEGNKIVVGSESVALYSDRFNVEVPTDGKLYDVVGIVGYFNNPQFMPLSFTESSFEINVPEFENGAIEVQPTARMNEEVLLTVVPNEGFELDELTVTTVDATAVTPAGAPRLASEPIELTKTGEFTYTFVMPASPVNVNATFKRSTTTAITGVEADGSQGMRYVNPMGQVSDRPFQGVNIVVNGNKTYKIVK